MREPDVGGVAPPPPPSAPGYHMQPTAQVFSYWSQVAWGG